MYDSTIGVLPVELSLGAQLGLGFATKIVRTVAGIEYRDRLRAYELGRWVVSYDATKRVRYQELYAFFRAARGMAYSFRAKDPLDYTVSSAEGKFVATDTATEWQMVKRYTTIGGATYDRKITKPGSGATSAAGTIDQDTGIVTNATMPASWQSPLFYVCVRFDADELLPRFIQRNGSQGSPIVAWEDIPVVEVHE